MSKFSPTIAARAIWQMRVRKRPFVLSHAVNSRCNMSCSFCEYWKEPGDEMSLDDIFRMLDDAHSFGIGAYNAWTVEPLLREDLPQILAYAKSKGMITSLITNGKLLKERINDLDDLDYLSVSVDGTKSYKEIRGIDFEIIMDAIMAVKDKLKNPLLMNCVISSKNLDDVEDLIQLARDIDVKISFEPLYEFRGIKEDVWGNMGIRDMEKYQCTIDRIIEMKKDGYPIINSLTYLKMIKELKKGYNCHVNNLILDVTADGSIENCRVHRESLGNVKDGIVNVWKASKDQQKELTEKCEGCFFFGYVENSLMYDLNLEVIQHYEWM
ncbi:radical SAM additional 4Fe4S-binding SPASM domain-containing protein [Methanococcoides vulcani]|uniref:Radical SAM additional 4Fe4S-binding SPASM domain-containing protein n=1 Tax=Methanococcoides vulcani TaxID=1353158 RepID=A0A1H9Z3Z5_9EURY|nr:radical SAM protein [Methanococcoides vulcani]SES75746.1 radical SAM additional 4Fe4S-binding SPASM domain-containing protein [Methanococcoides vulcani]